MPNSIAALAVGFPRRFAARRPVSVGVRPNLAVTNNSVREIVLRELPFRLEIAIVHTSFGSHLGIPVKKFADQN